jgi:hypothetical protein
MANARASSNAFSVPTTFAARMARRWPSEGSRTQRPALWTTASASAIGARMDAASVTSPRASVARTD